MLFTCEPLYKMGITKILSNKVIIGVQIIVYKILLDMYYVGNMMHKFEYFTICPDSKTFFTSVTSWTVLLLTFPAIFELFRKKTVSSQIILLLYFLSFIPSVVLLKYSANYPEFVLLISVYWLLFLYIGASDYTIKCNVKHTQSPFWTYLILLTIGAVIIYVSYKFTGFRIQMSLVDVYDIRFESREYNIPIIFDYILASSGTIMSLSLLYLLTKKKYHTVLIIIFLFVINFGIGGHKSVIFMLFVAIVGYLFYNKDRIVYLPPFFLFLVILCLFIPVFSALFAFRVLLLPASIHYAYYEFFNVRELDYMREGILSRFGFNTPYTDGIMYLIGEHTTGNIEIAANNGLFSDAYMNFGYVGIIVYPVILVIFLRIVDKFTDGMNYKLLFGIIFSFAMTLNSATFTTSLLTGGLLLSLLFIICVPKIK